MSETKFTPGPWIKRGFGALYLVGVPGRDVSVIQPAPDRHETLANAWLSSAAPELYEALVAALPILHMKDSELQALSGSHKYEGLRAVRLAEAALTKARGGE